MGIGHVAKQKTMHEGRFHFFIPLVWYMYIKQNVDIYPDMI